MPVIGRIASAGKLHSQKPCSCYGFGARHSAWRMSQARVCAVLIPGHCLVQNGLEKFSVFFQFIYMKQQLTLTLPIQTGALVSADPRNRPKRGLPVRALGDET